MKGPNRSTSSHLSDVLADVLDHHLVGSDGLHGEQAPVVDVRLAESDPLLAELQKNETNKNDVSLGRKHWCDGRPRLFA